MLLVSPLHNVEKLTIQDWLQGGFIKDRQNHMNSNVHYLYWKLL